MSKRQRPEWDREEALQNFTPRIQQELKEVNWKVNPKEDAKWLIEQNRGLYLIGPVGTGKTLYAAELTLQAMQYRHENRKGPITFRFIPVPELLQEIRNSLFDQQPNQANDLIEFYRAINWLVLDDIGLGKTTDWAMETLYLIINYRYEYLKPTIFTSNFTLGQLSVKFGDRRIPSRIKQTCKIYTLTGQDGRIVKQDEHDE